jgi:hypothetical protein
MWWPFKRKPAPPSDKEIADRAVEAQKSRMASIIESEPINPINYFEDNAETSEQPPADRAPEA